MLSFSNRGHARTFLKDLEKIRPSSILGEYLIRNSMEGPIFRESFIYVPQVDTLQSFWIRLPLKFVQQVPSVVVTESAMHSGL